MKCPLGKPHRHVDSYVRQASVQGENLPVGAEIWVRTEELPPNEAWDLLIVYDCQSNRRLAKAPLDRSRPRCKVQVQALAPLEAIRAIVLRMRDFPDSSDFPGRPPHEGDPTTLGDGNGAAPRVQP